MKKSLGAGIKKDFPIFTKHPDLIYLDNAATGQKPQIVIDAVVNFYKNHNSNVHRGIYDLSQYATDLYELSRKKVADFINAKNPKEIIFTGNASEAINLVYYGYASKFLKNGDVVVLSEMEHHSNLVPWLKLKETNGVKLFFLPINKNHELEYKQIENLDVKKIKLIALTHASNVLGTINPIKEIVFFVRKKNIKAKILIDAAQSIPHLPIDVKDFDCDFLAFSSHKMLGPSGVGVLWARKKLLEQMDPLFIGSHMIYKVTKEKATWTNIPDKFEVGTGRLEGVVGLGAAIDYLQTIGIKKIADYEAELTEYADQKLRSIDKLTVYGTENLKNRLGVFSFSIKNVHPHDVAEILNRNQICIRSGHHCAQPLMEVLNTTSTARASLYLYNTKEDVDKLVEGIIQVKKVFKV